MAIRKINVQKGFPGVKFYELVKDKASVNSVVGTRSCLNSCSRGNRIMRRMKDSLPRNEKCEMKDFACLLSSCKSDSTNVYLVTG